MTPMTALQTNLKKSMESFLETFPVDGMNQAILEESRKVCMATMALLEQNHAMAEILSAIVGKSDWIAQRTFMTAFFTSAISQNVPFNSPRTTEYAMLGAYLHDIGIPALPLEVQVKSIAELPAASASLYETHSVLGADLVRRANMPEPVAQIVLQHHEHINNTGYPYKLSGIKMYPLAKIVSLADAFSEYVILSGKVPLQALKDFAINRINVEKHDPDAIRALIKAFIKGKTP